MHWVPDYENDFSHSLSLFICRFISRAHLGYDADFNSGLTQDETSCPMGMLCVPEAIIKK